jgi:hypothetical protein
MAMRSMNVALVQQRPHDEQGLVMIVFLGHGFGR